MQVSVALKVFSTQDKFKYLAENEILAITNDCKIEMPSHPGIIFVRSNQSEMAFQNVSYHGLRFVPRMRITNENGGSSCQSDENPGQLIQYFLESNAVPIIKLQCTAATSLCEIGVHKIQGIIHRGIQF